MGITLADEECQMLAEILNDALPNLREEVYKTDNYSFREQLKRREAMIKSLLERLAAAEASRQT